MALLDGVAWEGKVFKGGAWTDGRGGTYAVVEPATGNELGTMGQADAEDVAEAAASAAEAQKEWAALPHTARAAVLRRAGDLWAEHADEIRDWNVREVGAIPPMADFAMHVAAEECYQAASLPGQPIGQVLPSEQPRLSMARQLPAGVVAVISPFNVPIILGIRSVAPALALGNAVLLKPDPRTAVTGGTVMARIFEEAGLPAGVLQMLPGGKDVGEAMVTDPHVRVISFTGSTAVGRSIGELAGRHLKRAHLELGGNSALLILDDADVEKAVGLTGWASFLNQGQICMTTGRYFVADGIYDDFVDQLAAKAGHLPVGDPATEQVALGPVIDERSAGQDPRPGHGERRPGRAPGRGRGVRPALLPADRAGRGPARPRPSSPRRSSARSLRSPGSPRSRKRYGWPRRATTGSRSASSPAT